MKIWFKDFVSYYEDEIKAISIFITILGLFFGIGGAVMLNIVGKSYQYNCNLNAKPSMKVTFFINDSVYAYDPDGFCKQLKEKMRDE